MPRVIVFLAVAISVSFVVGCGSTQLRSKKTEPIVASARGSVAVQRWPPFLPLQRLELNHATNTLRDVISKTSSGENDQLIRALKNRFKDERDPRSALMNEDVIALRRANQTWYFPKPWIAVDEVANIRVIDSDIVAGLHLDKTVFGQEFEKLFNHQGNEVSIYVGGAASPIRATVQLTDRFFITIQQDGFLKSLPEKVGEEAIKDDRLNRVANVAVVSRKLGNEMYHLVIPRIQGHAQDWLPAAVQDILIKGEAKLQSNDVVELTELSIFIQRF